MNVLDMNELIKPNMKLNLSVPDVKPTDYQIKRTSGVLFVYC